MYYLDEGDEGYIPLTAEQELARQLHTETTCRKLQAYYPWLFQRLEDLIDKARARDNNLKTSMVCFDTIMDLTAGPFSHHSQFSFASLMWAMLGAFASGVTFIVLRATDLF